MPDPEIPEADDTPLPELPSDPSNMLASVVRTVVPYLVAYVVAFLAKRNIIVTEDQVAGIVPVIGGTLYYVAVRYLEKKYPKAGYLLGIPKPPVYPVKAA